MAADKNFLEIVIATLQRYPEDQKFSQNCSISHGFRDISIFVFGNLCKKFKNSKWPPFLARQNILGKIEMATLQKYPMDQKVCQNSLSSTVFEI